MFTFRCTQCGGLNRVPQNRVEDGPVCGRCKARIDTSGTPQAVTDEELTRIIQASPVPVLVDFWAPWCGPCRAAAPVLERIGKNRPGRVLLLKINSDEHPGAAARHRISGIPAFVMFYNGHEVGRQVGLLPERAFGRWIDGFAMAA